METAQIGGFRESVTCKPINRRVSVQESVTSSPIIVAFQDAGVTYTMFVQMFLFPKFLLLGLFSIVW